MPFKMMMMMMMMIQQYIRRRNVVLPVHAMNTEQRQTASDPCTKLTHLSHWPAFRQLWNYIHHRHLSLLSPEADTHLPSHRG